MYYSLLDIVDDYIRSNGIPFRFVDISRSYFPDFFNEAVERELLKLNTKAQMDKNYRFMYDDNDNLVLIASSGEGKTRLLMCDRVQNLSINLPCTRIYYDRILSKATLKEYLLADQKAIKETVYKTLPNVDEETKNKLVDDLMGHLIHRMNYELKSHDESILDRHNTYKDMLITANDVMAYIRYLNSEYSKTREIATIMYTPAEPEETGIARDYVGNSAIERKNFVLAVADRTTVLETFPFLYSCSAKSTNTNRIDYLCYLYKISDTEYKLVLEPYNGISYTKVINFTHKGEIEPEKFADITKKYLEYSNRDSIEADNVVRVAHTTIDTYENAILYSLTNDSERYNCNQYTKNNIDSSEYISEDDLVL